MSVWVHPLDLFFANVFMDQFEKLHMAELRNLGVLTWFRFVDDTFVVLNKKSDAEQVLGFLNKQHKNMRFTSELEKDGRIPFLDVLVKRNGRLLTSSIYRKPTYTGVYLRWTSLTSRRYKLGLIYNLLDRAWKICSDSCSRELEVRRIKSVLSDNGYPAEVLDHQISRFVLNRAKWDKVTSQLATDVDEPPKAVEKEKEKIRSYIKLPYVNDKSRSSERN